MTSTLDHDARMGRQLSRGILFRTALLALAVISFTLGFFILLIIPIHFAHLPRIGRNNVKPESNP
ncbi:MAG TPA: hypothetical protein DIU35_18255 [Candidatus Latescibacteria bacterium]|nr:hypothetical protein [Gemmatimonadota bacterium]HCR19425.1 hypothetical protein [Candidatus Latescibacterota bacterium]